MLVILISILFAILVSSPYIAGVLQQAPGTTFAGVVHYPPDYFYYLSYMAQGKFRWLTSFYLSTQEATKPVFYHWFYVLSGRIFAVLHISDIVGYQLLVLGLTIVLLLVSYRLIRKVVPSPAGRTIAYILFLASNAWPYLVNTPHGWTVQYYTVWYNFGEPFIRFSSIPHHLLAQSVLIVALLLLTRLPHPGHSRFLSTWFFILMSGFLLASTQTPLVLVVVLTYGIFWVKDIIIRSRDTKTFLSAAISSPVFPALVFLCAGAGPYMIYLRMLFQQPVYSVITSWEPAQQVRMTTLQFFQVNGPVMLLGVAGLPLFISKRTRVRSVIIVFTIISWIIFLSKIPAFISVLNVRFLSVVPTLTMACSAAALIEAIGRRVAPRLQMPITIAVTVLIVGLTLPATVQQIVARATFDPVNAYYFLPNGAMDVYQHIDKFIQPQETCLVIWPFHISFAGLTGRRSFTANEYGTINYGEKEQLEGTFFSDTTPFDQKVQILKSNKLSCVVTYSFTRNLPMSVLTAVYQNSYMTIYRVKE